MTVDTDSLSSLRIDRSREVSSGGPSPKVWIAAGAGALIVLAVLAWIFFGPEPTEVSTITATAESSGQSSGTAVLNASGYVVVRRIATVSSKVTGKIEEILVEEGMEVEKDQVIARLDPTNLGAVLNIAERELEASRRGLAEIEVRLAEARRNLERNESLVQRQLISQTALDASRAEVKALEARLAASQAQIKVSESAVAMRRIDYNDLQVRAPFGGVVISKDAQPGEIVSPMSAGGGFTRTGIATIVDMDSREIEVDVNEAYINRVSAGQRVEASLDAYPGAPMAAHVINIVPTADRTKATVKVRIAFDELEPRILPDMGIKVRFLEDRPAQAANAGPRIRIPSAAVQGTGDDAYVFVIGDGRVERRAVTVGTESEGMVEVRGGLTGGEELVSPLVPDLEDGDKVKVRAG